MSTHTIISKAQSLAATFNRHGNFGLSSGMDEIISEAHRVQRDLDAAYAAQRHEEQKNSALREQLERAQNEVVNLRAVLYSIRQLAEDNRG